MSGMSDTDMKVNVSKAERQWRGKNKIDIKSIKHEDMVCASCHADLSKLKDKPAKLFSHPLMGTLQCKKCNDFYGSGNFSLDEDGTDKYCRLCGNGGALYICDNEECPFGFCSECIERNLKKECINEASADGWKCYSCNSKPFWRLRNICATAVEGQKKPMHQTKKSSRREAYSDSESENHSEPESSEGIFESSKVAGNRRNEVSFYGRQKRSEAKRLKHKLDSLCDIDSDDETVVRRRPCMLIDKMGQITDTDTDQEEQAQTKKLKDSRFRKRSTASDGIVTSKKQIDTSKQKSRTEQITDTDTDQEEEAQTKQLKDSRIKKRSTASDEIETSKKRIDTSKQKSRTEQITDTDTDQEEEEEEAQTKQLKVSRIKKRSTESDEIETSKKRIDTSKQKSRTEQITDTDTDQEEEAQTKQLKVSRIKKRSTASDEIETSNKRIDIAKQKSRTEQSSDLDESDHSWIRCVKSTPKNVQKWKQNSKLDLEPTKSHSKSDDNADSKVKIRKSKNSKPPGGKSKRKPPSNSDSNSDNSASDRDTSKNSKPSGRKSKPKSSPSSEELSSGTDFQSPRMASRHIKSHKIRPLYKLDEDITTIDTMASKKLSLAKGEDSKKVAKNRKADALRECSKGVLHKLAVLGKALRFSAHKLDNLENSSAPSFAKQCMRLINTTKARLEELSMEMKDSWSKGPIVLADLTNTPSDSNQYRSSSKQRGRMPANDSNSDISTSDDEHSCETIKLNLKPAVSEGTTKRKRSCPSSSDAENETIVSKDNEKSAADQSRSDNADMSECDSETICSGNESTRNEDKRKSLLDKSTASILVESREAGSGPSSPELFTDSLMEDGDDASNNQAKKTQDENDSKDEGHKPRERKSSETEQSYVSAKGDEDGNVCSSSEDERKKKLLDSDSESNNGNMGKKDISQLGNRDSSDDSDVQTNNVGKRINRLDSKKSKKSTEENEKMKLLNSDSDNSEGNIRRNDESKLSDSNVSEAENDTAVQQEEQSINVGKRVSRSNSEKSEESIKDSVHKSVCSDSEEMRKLKLINSDSEDSNDNIPRSSKSQLSKSDLSDVEGDAKDESDEQTNDVEEKESRLSLNSDKSAKDSDDNNGSSDSEGEKERELSKIGSKNSKDINSSGTEKHCKYQQKDTTSNVGKRGDRTNSQKSDESATGRTDKNAASDSEERIKMSLLYSNSEDSVGEDTNSPGEADVSSKSKRLKAKKKNADSSSSDSEDDRKMKLLASGSSASDMDCILPTPVNVGKKKQHCTDSDSSVSSKPKKKKFKPESNTCFQNDMKLRMNCTVSIQRMKQTVLDRYSHVLMESARRKENRKFKSLVDLDNLDKRRTRANRSDSDNSDSSNSRKSSRDLRKKRKSKQEQNKEDENEETLLDHLEKVKNGELNEIQTDCSDNEDRGISKNMPNENAEEEIMKEANKLAKECLLNSSDSDNEVTETPEDADNEAQESDSGSKKISEAKKNETNDEEPKVNGDKGKNEENTEREVKETSQEKGEESETEEEKQEKQEKRDKSKWRQDKILTFKLSDSDSSDEQKKWNKSQEKKKIQSENKSDSNSDDEEGRKRKRMKKTKRKILTSDSDSLKLSDDSSNDSDVKIVHNKKKKNNSNSEDSDVQMSKGSKKKRNVQKSSNESDTSITEKRPKPKRRRIKTVDTDSGSDVDLDNSQGTPGKFGRKNIRKVLKDKQVADDTKQAAKEEEERLKRISDRQKLYNEMYEMRLAGELKVDKLVLDFDEETKEDLVSVHEDLVKRLKPHQAKGIKFMWDACFESLERAKSTKGSGCIVAHCMGLGKSFQVVTLAHTLLTNEATGIKTIMVVCPLSTVLNWMNEFKMWLKDIENGDEVNVFEMTRMKKNFERKCHLEQWNREGGVMIIGYEMFRNLSNPGGKKMRKNMQESILKCMVDPGADLIVCDEGHLLKNEDTALSKSMRRVKTLRRIVLTGTPLQNNLVEYHCMVQFVKPNLLGSKKEFLNRFVNPITNGQFDDSTAYDVKVMKKRAHVLHKMLEGSVQRFDYSVLTPFLPPKEEYVISVKLSDIQNKLYQHYLDHFARRHKGSGGSLFADFQALQRIWTHPIVVRLNAEKMERLNEKKRLDDSESEGSLVDFIDDGSEEDSSSSGSDVQSVHESGDENVKNAAKRGTRANPTEEEPVVVEDEVPEATEWWAQYVQPEDYEDLRVSAKVTLLFAILKQCEIVGDKVLVFSQSLYSLTLIERFLAKIDEQTQNETNIDLVDGHHGSWSEGLDYFRLDGQTSAENRSIWCRIFNKESNTRARLFLISTRAGGLGINLTAANRVIIFDASWNPSHDVQSIFRIYRFGQKKPCYVYRFLAHGTMEEKIYNRQVTKLSLSCRVVDEQQIERHYSNNDLAELYKFDPSDNSANPVHSLPKDRVLAEILLKYSNRIGTYHEHDSLLENKAEEELDEEERKQAWLEYEQEKKGKPAIQMNYQIQNQDQNLYWQQYIHNLSNAANQNQSGEYEKLQALIRKDYPHLTSEQQRMQTSKTLMDMYRYVENQAVNQNPLRAMLQSNYVHPSMSNPAVAAFSGMNPMAQQQYAVQQQQMHHLIMQRDQQMNYAKQHGNIRGLNPKPAVTQPVRTVNVNSGPVDDDVIEVPATPASTTATSAQPSTSTGNSKRQEE